MQRKRDLQRWHDLYDANGFSPEVWAKVEAQYERLRNQRDSSVGVTMTGWQKEHEAFVSGGQKALNALTQERLDVARFTRAEGFVPQGRAFATPVTPTSDGERRNDCGF
jgi:hypothetical protein